MKNIASFFIALGATLSLISCGADKPVDLTGSWSASAPQSVTTQIAGATSATKTLALDFKNPASDGTSTFTMTADYDVTMPATSDKAAYSYTVTATVNGTYTRDNNDSDEFLLSFDKNSLNVTGTDAPELGAVTDEFLNSLGAFTKIDDVVVSKDGRNLTLETSKPEMKYRFIKK